MRDPVRYRRITDLAFRSHQPLGHGGLGHKEGARDFRGRESSQEPQRQRHLRVGRQRGMTAREDQPEAIVVHHILLGVAARVQQRSLGVPVVSGRLAPQAIDPSSVEPFGQLMPAVFARRSSAHSRRRLGSRTATAKRPSTPHVLKSTGIGEPVSYSVRSSARVKL
jgi:hypothetical protein